MESAAQTAVNRATRAQSLKAAGMLTPSRLPALLGLVATLTGTSASTCARRRVTTLEGSPPPIASTAKLGPSSSGDRVSTAIGRLEPAGGERARLVIRKPGDLPYPAVQADAPPWVHASRPWKEVCAEVLAARPERGPFDSDERTARSLEKLIDSLDRKARRDRYRYDYHLGLATRVRRAGAPAVVAVKRFICRMYVSTSKRIERGADCEGHDCPWPFEVGAAGVALLSAHPPDLDFLAALATDADMSDDAPLLYLLRLGGDAALGILHRAPAASKSSYSLGRALSTGNTPASLQAAAAAAFRFYLRSHTTPAMLLDVAWRSGDVRVLGFALEYFAGPRPHHGRPYLIRDHADCADLVGSDTEALRTGYVAKNVCLRDPTCSICPPSMSLPQIEFPKPAPGSEPPAWWPAPYPRTACLEYLASVDPPQEPAVAKRRQALVGFSIPPAKLLKAVEADGNLSAAVYDALCTWVVFPWAAADKPWAGARTVHEWALELLVKVPPVDERLLASFLRRPPGWWGGSPSVKAVGAAAFRALSARHGMKTVVETLHAELKSPDWWWLVEHIREDDTNPYRLVAGVAMWKRSGHWVSDSTEDWGRLLHAETRRDPRFTPFARAVLERAAANTPAYWRALNALAETGSCADVEYFAEARDKATTLDLALPLPGSGYRMERKADFVRSLLEWFCDRMKCDAVCPAR